MPGPPVSRAVRAESNRAAASLSNLRGRVSVVKEGYGFIQVERPERASVYVHRSTIVNPRPKDSRNFGLQEGDRVILDIKESPPQFKARYQAVRVQLEDSDADAALNSSPSVPASGPKKTEITEKEIINQVGTICSVNENGGTLRFGAGSEEFVVFDRRCVPNTLLKPTEKVSEIFSVGNKVGFNARLANTGAGAAQWQATLVTTVLRGNTSQVFVFDTEPLTRSTRHDSKKDFGNELTRVTSTSDPRAPFQSSQRCPASGASSILKLPAESCTLAAAASFLLGPTGTDKTNSSLDSDTNVAPGTSTPIVTQISSGSGASSIRPRSKLPAESRTLITAASYSPVSASTNNSSLVFDTNVAPARSAPTATQISSGNGASAVRLHGQLSTKSRTLSAESYLPVSANTNNSSLVFDTNVAPARSAPTATQISSGNGAPAVRLHGQLSTKSRTLSAESYLPVSANTSNSSLVFDTNVAPGRPTPTATQISSVNGASAVRPRTLSAASYLPVSAATSKSSLVYDSNVAPQRSTPTVTQISSKHSALAVQLSCELPTEPRTLSAASYAPCPVKTEGSHSSSAFYTNATPRTPEPVATQSSSENGASVFPPRCQLSTLFRTLSPTSSHSVNAKTEGNNSSPVIDANVSSGASAPAVIQRSSVATERPEEEDRPAIVPQRCKPRWAFDITRSSTKLDTAAPAGGHPIPAGTDQPSKITPFEKTPRQCIPLATNSHGTDSTGTAVRQQAPRSGDRPPTTSGDRRPTTTTGDRLPTTAGDHKRPATAISMERVTCQHCGAGEDEQGLAEAIAEMVTSCLRSVIREEVQALRHEFLGPTGITAGAGDMSSGHQGSSRNAPKGFPQSRKTPLQAVQGRDAATGLRK